VPVEKELETSDSKPVTVEAVIEGNVPMDQDEVKFDEEENRIRQK